MRYNPQGCEAVSKKKFQMLKKLKGQKKFQKCSVKFQKDVNIFQEVGNEFKILKIYIYVLNLCL